MKRIGISIAALLMVTCIYAQPGSLDNTFNGTGTVSLPLGPASSFVKAICLQADGKIVVSGSSSNGTDNDFAVLRFNEDGSLDTTFNHSGTVLTDFGGTDNFGAGIAIQPADGKLVVGGYSDNGDGFNFALIRYLSNGITDSTFGTDGRIFTGAGVTSFATALAIQPNGKILIAGYALSPQSLTNRFTLMRFNENGTPDNTFNFSGKTTTQVGTDAGIATSMVIQSVDGKIILAGHSFNPVLLRWEFALVRYNTDGSPDNSFGSGSIVITPVSGADGYINAVALQPDGKIVIAGNTGTTPSNNRFTLARYKTDGLPDSAFGTNGILIGSAGPQNNQAKSLLIRSDNRIFAGGSASVSNADNFAITGYLEDGSFDNTFGTSGVVKTTVGSNDGISAMAFQADGKIAAAGTAFNGTAFNIALARYNADVSTGISNIQQSEQLFTVYPNPVHQTTTLSYTLPTDDIISVCLMDAMGRPVGAPIYSGRKSAGIHTFQIEFDGGLPAGIYLISCVSSSGKRVVKVVYSK